MARTPGAEIPFLPFPPPQSYLLLKPLPFIRTGENDLQKFGFLIKKGSEARRGEGHSLGGLEKEGNPSPRSWGLHNGPEWGKRPQPVSRTESHHLLQEGLVPRSRKQERGMRRDSGRRVLVLPGTKPGTLQSQITGTEPVSQKESLSVKVVRGSGIQIDHDGMSRECPWPRPWRRAGVPGPGHLPLTFPPRHVQPATGQTLPPSFQLDSPRPPNSIPKPSQHPSSSALSSPMSPFISSPSISFWGDLSVLAQPSGQRVPQST